MSIWVYRLVVMPLAALILPLIAPFNRKMRRGLSLRMRPRDFPRFAERPVWIHASSGEFEYAKPVIRAIRARYPGTPILATYFSPSYALAVENFPGVDFAMPLPLDLPGPCSSFLKRFNPRLLLIARTDLWPEMLTQTRARAIPIRVFSFTQRPDRPGLLARWRLNLADEIDCVSEADLSALKALGVRARLNVLGDTRYDQVQFRLSHTKELPVALKPVRPCFVAGSTWPQDEAVLIPGLRAPLKEGLIQLILVPHEPTPKHISDLRLQLDRAGLSHALYSKGDRWSDKEVLLVDKVGVLAELYLWADLAFVGGSFRRNVHSVMEALGAGCRTWIGPRHTNNREAMEFQQVNLGGAPAVLVVGNAPDLENSVRSVLSDSQTLFQMKLRLQQEFSRRLGASRRLVDTLSI